MKILWLYKFKADYNFDSFLHMDVARYLKGHPGVEVMAYGPGLRNAYPTLTQLEYQPTYYMQTLYDHFNFDIVIINTKSRCFDFYNPKTKQQSPTWLPGDFHHWKKTPKIVLEEDYHYETDDSWYKEMGIDLILQRHYSQVARQQHVPMKWLPFSVDTNVFNDRNSFVEVRGRRVSVPDSGNRQKKFAMVGNDADAAYVYRRSAIQRLADLKLGVSFSGSKKVDGEYLEVLRQYIGYVSCGSIYEITAAKNFEIMASGGVLLTNQFVGIDLLFPTSTYMSYKTDLSDLEMKANMVLTDNQLRHSIVMRAHHCINQRHTHPIRTQEMVRIIEDMR